MAELVEKVNDNDRLVFFFSGYASQIYSPSGEFSGDGFTEGISSVSCFSPKVADRIKLYGQPIMNRASFMNMCVLLVCGRRKVLS